MLPPVLSLFNRRIVRRQVNLGVRAEPSPPDLMLSRLSRFLAGRRLDTALWACPRSYSSSTCHTISNSVKTTNRPRKSPLVGRQAPLTLTPAAVVRIKELLRQRPDAVGLRVGVKTRGCSGLSYTLEFCTDGQREGDEAVEQDGVKVFIDRRAQLSLLGTEMDFQEGVLAILAKPNVALLHQDFMLLTERTGCVNGISYRLEHTWQPLEKCKGYGNQHKINDQFMASSR
ncbi:hypothetical protein T265_03994 [Opisthorchis viverrini]|uniref:Iron-sulfur cluster assembly 1 homolog, mitochondrial n=1 Tax=Opisthorchis viverrini TaxID=6198 RepID=A0A074ZU22_OPIVI|nr:hypothetical protein T265_03994 [Opisthorchis viverrini]KER29327.1 hypothetical protein T265_03994 [Opisthorchis viverrini]